MRYNRRVGNTRREKALEATPAWRIVRVDDLPWAHNPFRCRWKKEFDATGTGDFGAFVRGLAPDELAECPYHDGLTDWVEAARVAVELVEAGGPDPGDGYEPAETHTGCTPWAIVSFFAYPIHLDGDRLGNGQHRVCAMKVTGVERCPILK